MAVWRDGLVEIARVDDPASIHHQHGGAGLADNAQVVADKQQSRTGFLPNYIERLQGFMLGDHIKTGGWFIGYQNSWL